MLELLLSYERREFLQFLSSSTVKSYLHLLEGKCEKFHFNIRLRILFTHNWAQLRTKSLNPKHGIRYLYTTESNFQTKILPIWYKYSHKLLLNTNALNRKVNRAQEVRARFLCGSVHKKKKEKGKKEGKHPSLLPGPQTQSGSTSGRFDRTGGNSILQYERLIVVPRDWTFDFETWAALVAVNQAEVTNRFSIVSRTVAHVEKGEVFRYTSRTLANAGTS